MRNAVRDHLIVLVLTVMAGAAATLAQEAPAAGSVVGSVTEITRQYVLVRSDAGMSRRYWYKWTDVPTSRPDDAMLVAVARFKPSDRVALKWTSDGDRYRVDAIEAAPTTPARQVQPATSQPGPSVSSSDVGLAGSTSSEKTIGDTVNAWIDDLLVFGERVLELPLLLIVPALAVVTIVGGRVVGRFRKPADRARLSRRIAIAQGVLGVVLVLYIVDRKLSRLESAVRDVRSQNTSSAAVLAGELAKRPNTRPAARFNPDEIAKKLAPQFGLVTIKPLLADEAIDLLQVRTSTPYSVSFLAMIDLRHPAVQIKLGTNLQAKTLTSAFARQNDCVLAINGEAGISPISWTGLGSWRGTLVDGGKQLLNEDPANPRPYLWFDAKNHAAFTPASMPGRKPPPDAMQAIWGRWDLLSAGVVQAGDARDRQPRTAMAISQDGATLLLMVVDGRQPRYSNGFTRTEAGTFLRAFGAFHGMLCDEGGSSCMYVRSLGGICNIPSDSQGQERPTYTHFGISLRSN